jgi:hypothetical protein
VKNGMEERFMFFDNLVVRVRQKLFPPEFRITAGSGSSVEAILTEMAAAMDLAPEITTAIPVVPAPAVVEPSAQVAEVKTEQDGVDPAFVRALCNDLFRLRRNAGLIASDGTETKEIRSIKRAVERLDDMLKQRGIEYFDMTGKQWDARDVDFEPKGQPVLVSGLLHKRIAACECPMVKVKGKLIQRAQGIVEVPAQEGTHE